MKSVIGDWSVEIEGRERQFKVTYANTFDEPVGGLMNVLLTEDGQHYQHTERCVCRAIEQPCFSQRYIPQIPNRDGPLTKRIVDLAMRYGRYGYRRITALLQAEGWWVNHKRVERIWRLEALEVPQK